MSWRSFHEDFWRCQLHTWWILSCRCKWRLMELRDRTLVQSGGLVRDSSCRSSSPYRTNLSNVNLFFGSDWRRVRSKKWNPRNYWALNQRRSNHINWKHLCSVDYRQHSRHPSTSEARLRTILGYDWTRCADTDTSYTNCRCCCWRLRAHTPVIWLKRVTKDYFKARCDHFARLIRLLDWRRQAYRSLGRFTCKTYWSNNSSKQNWFPNCQFWGPNSHNWRSDCAQMSPAELQISYTPLFYWTSR